MSIAVEETIVSKQFKCFILGQCACGCGESINIRTERGLLKRFIKNHDKRGNTRMVGDKHWNWKRGRRLNRGYWELLMPDYFSAHKNGYVYEHIYNFQEYHKCCMLKWGIVHHIDGTRTNNMIWNLQGMTNNKHQLYHHGIDMLDRYCCRCKSSKTYIKKNGRPMWYDEDGKYLCKNCYDKRPVRVEYLKNYKKEMYLKSKK